MIDTPKPKSGADSGLLDTTCCVSFATCDGCHNVEVCHMTEACYAKILEHAHREGEAYIKAGICSHCDACSAKDAETKCRPMAIGDTGDYDCPGEVLWQESPHNVDVEARRK